MDIHIPPDLLDVFASTEMQQYTNIRLMQPAHVAELLPSAVPAHWRREQEVDWDPTAPGQPSVEV